MTYFNGGDPVGRSAFVYGIRTNIVGSVGDALFASFQMATASKPRACAAFTSQSSCGSARLSR